MRKLPNIKNYETFPKVNPTVDIACFNHIHTHIILGRKSHEDKMRLPGGFADPNDSSYEESAIREFKEETNSVIKNIEYVLSCKQDDPRFVDSDDKIFTILFYAQLFDDQDLEAMDDLAEVRWVELNALYEDGIDEWIVPEHKVLINKALDYAQRRHASA